MILDPLHGDGYQFWSGIGGGSPLFVLVALWWHRHNCHQPRCFWVVRQGHTHCKRHRRDGVHVSG